MTVAGVATCLLADELFDVSGPTVLVLGTAFALVQARDKVKRNVVLLCAAPKGQDGRPSKALTLADAEKLLEIGARGRRHEDAEIPPNARVAGAGRDRVGLASDPASRGARTRRHGVV